VKDLPDGRRFITWDEAPDLDLPCSSCGAPWPAHPGQVEIGTAGGHAGLLLPACPEGTPAGDMP
jgi:hypothetical protein